MPEQPADTLRRAAEALNLAAIGAKTSAAGRWYVRTPRGHYPQSIADNGSAVLVADTCEGGPQRLAPFIASMDPTFAFKVATLLETVADDMEPGAPSWDAAVAAARAYLGES